MYILFCVSGPATARGLPFFTYKNTRKKKKEKRKGICLLAFFLNFLLIFF